MYYKPNKQSCNYAQKLKGNHSGKPLNNQTWQTEWKTAPLATEHLCEDEDHTSEVFVVARHLYAKFDWPVAHQNFSALATGHDCETSAYSL